MTAAERRQHSGWLRREAKIAGIPALPGHDLPIEEIMRRTGKSRGLLREVVRGVRNGIFRGRMNSLEPFLVKARAAGSRDGAGLRRAVKAQRFTGSLRVVGEWATGQRKDAGTATRRDNRPGKTPSARGIAHAMTTERDALSKVGHVPSRRSGMPCLIRPPRGTCSIASTA